MKYTVFWSPAAEESLANLWLTAEDRDAVRRAADSLDELLSKNPNEVGESRLSPARIELFPPLGIEFKVRESDRTVLVISVWAPRRRGN